MIINPYAFGGGGAPAVVWDALNMHSSYTLSLANTAATSSNTSGANWESVRATAAATVKSYYEGTMTAGGNTTVFVGLANGSQAMSGDTFPGKVASSIGYLAVNGQIHVNSVVVNTGPTYTTNDVIGVAFDPATGNVWFSKNGTWILSGNPATGVNPLATGFTGSLYPACGNLNAAATFKGRWALANFITSPPAGFSAWS